MRSLPIMFSSGSVHSSLGIKGISITIFRLKFIFVWISLMPQPIGNVLNWDFVLIFSVFTFFRISSRFIL